MEIEGWFKFCDAVKLLWKVASKLLVLIYCLTALSSLDYTVCKIKNPSDDVLSL